MARKVKNPLKYRKYLLAETVLRNPFIPHAPTKKQATFLTESCLECLYGGAAGGGKSDAILMAALQFVDCKGYHALILRRTYADLTLQGAIMQRADEWLRGTPARWVAKDKCWVFPSGATLTFGYLQNENDKYRYQSSEFQFIGFDELTQFTETQYAYLFSRLRRSDKHNQKIPLRMRSASNPANIGHKWVKSRLVEGDKDGRKFIRATLKDNPHLDEDEYRRSLSELDPITREQLLNGDWDIRPEGGIFKREWCDIITPQELPPNIRWCRSWDLAATVKKKPSDDPDWTAGALLGLSDGVWYLKHVNRFRANPKGVQDSIRATASSDTRSVQIIMEQEGGSGGVNTIDYYRRNVLVGYKFSGYKPMSNKRDRAAPVSSAMEAGNFKIVKGNWNEDFFEEIEFFPFGAHDDMIDAVSQGFEYLSNYEPIMLA